MRTKLTLESHGGIFTALSLRGQDKQIIVHCLVFVFGLAQEVERGDL